MNGRTIVRIGPDDDGFHAVSDDWWETETAWFSFNVPHHKMGGWLYNQVLPNQRICNGGAWVWDDSSAGARYELRLDGLRMPSGADLRDVTLPNGNSITMLEPLTRYRLRYADPMKLEVDLEFQALMQPHSHPLGVAPFWKGRHFDQAGRITGEIVLFGEKIDVDCISVRDRSWGPRPRAAVAGGGSAPASVGKPKRPPWGIGYMFGSASPNEAFLAYTIPMIRSDNVSAGYLIRDGIYAQLVAGRRTIEFEAATRWISRVTLDAQDEKGRALHAVGELVSHHGETGPSGTGLFYWEWDRELSGWGEDQSYASEEIWRSLGAPPPGH